MKQDVRPASGGINRILVRGVNWVGDTVLTYPAVEQLKRFFPKSHLAVLVPRYLVDLWKTCPYVDEIIPFQKKAGIGSIWGEVTLSRSLKEKHFDLAVILPRSFRSAFPIYLARIPIRIGYRDEWPSLFLTHGIGRTKEVLQGHRVHYYRKVIEPLGKIENFPSPQLLLREEDQKWADQTLKDLGIPEGKPLIGMNPGATYGSAKCWHPERFGELGKRVADKWQTHVLLFGKEGERAVVTEVNRHIGTKGIDLTGKTGLLQLAALLKRCSLLVTNDTGTMHIATAVGTPVVALFGPTPRLTTGPWGEGHAVVSRDVSCSPCWKRICPTDHRCMEEITVGEVEQVVEKQLRRKRQ